jgi:hypothetical protein
VRVGTDPDDTCLAADALLARFAPNREQARRAFRAFIAVGLDDRVDERVVGERIGRPDFLRDRFGMQLEGEVPRTQIEPLPPPLEELFAGADQREQGQQGVRSCIHACRRRCAACVTPKLVGFR